MRNAGLEETQAGIKIAGKNINNLRYADDTTLAFPLDLGARPLCRRLRGQGCANCQSLPQAELFVRQRERPGLFLDYLKHKILKHEG